MNKNITLAKNYEVFNLAIEKYTSGGIKLLLRAEGFSVMLAACIAYNNISSDWKQFFGCFSFQISVSLVI